jgi:hypothetical protein
MLLVCGSWSALLLNAVEHGSEVPGGSVRPSPRAALAALAAAVAGAAGGGVPFGETEASRAGVGCGAAPFAVRVCRDPWTSERPVASAVPDAMPPTRVS